MLSEPLGATLFVATRTPTHHVSIEDASAWKPQSLHSTKIVSSCLSPPVVATKHELDDESESCARSFRAGAVMGLGVSSTIRRRFVCTGVESRAKTIDAAGRFMQD